MGAPVDRLRELVASATPGPWRVDPASLEHDAPLDGKPACYGIAAGKQTWHRNQGLFHPSNAKYDKNEFEPVQIGYDRDYGTPEAAIYSDADARLIALAPQLAELVADMGVALGHCDIWGTIPKAECDALLARLARLAALFPEDSA